MFRTMLVGLIGFALSPPVFAQGYWYYCEPARAYYPYVETCPVPWRKVAADPSVAAHPAIEEAAPNATSSAPAASGTAQALSSNSAAATPPTAEPSAVYKQGQIDRQNWENWYASQKGDYHAGAEYWAAHRSTPHPQSCSATPPSTDAEWTAGCYAAQRMLAEPDVRRRTEPDYRRGWNSASQGPIGTVISPPPTSATASNYVTSPPPQGSPASPQESSRPRETPEGVPIEKDAVLINTHHDTLVLIDRLVQLVKANGYRCDSVSGFLPYVFSLGFTLHCDNFAYKYEFEDRGRGYELKRPK